MTENIKSTNNLSGLYIVYNGSCNLERPGIYGISHLMEHLVCKAFDHLQDEFDAEGISWNAYTSSNEIVFHWTGLEENLSKYRDKFLKLISKFDITEEEFENERKIVLQEYYDAFNDQTDVHYLNLKRKEFNHYGAIGLAEDLKSLTFKDCKDYFKLQFSTPSKVINVSKEDMKNVKTKGVKDFSEFTNDPFKYNNKKNSEATLEKGANFDAKRSIIVFSELIKNQKHIAPVQMIIRMLSSGLNSPLYQEIRESQGLVYYIQNWLGHDGDEGSIFFATLTTDDNVDKFNEALKDILNNPKKYLTQKRFDLIKKKALISYKKANINMHVNVDKYINSKEWVLENNIEDLTLENCMEIYDEYFNVKKLTFTTDKDY